MVSRTTRAVEPQWLRDQQIRIQVQIALHKHPALPKMPLAADYAKTDDDRRALELALAPLVIARPFLAPAEVPAERVALLRRAFIATLEDPLFKEDIAKARIDTYGAMSGDAVQAFVTRMYQTPPAIVAKVAALLKG